MKHLQKYNEGIFSINKNKNREKGIDKWSEEIFKGLNDSGVKTIKSNLDDVFNTLISWECVYKQHKILINLYNSDNYEEDYELTFSILNSNLVPIWINRRYASNSNYILVYSLENILLYLQDIIQEILEEEIKKKKLLKLSEDMSKEDIKDITSELNDEIGEPINIDYVKGCYRIYYNIKKINYISLDRDKQEMSDEYTRFIIKINEINNKAKELYDASVFLSFYTIQQNGIIQSMFLEIKKINK